MQGLEAEQREPAQRAHVLYVGTFSKTLVSGLRLGYMIVPDELVDAFRAARSTVDRHTPTSYQHVLADFIGEGHYIRHIRHVRNLCGERQAALVDAASKRLTGLIDIAPDAAGLHLLGQLAPGIDDMVAHEAAMARGVRSWALSKFYLGASARGGALVLGYGGFNDRQIRVAVDMLAGVLRLLSPRGAAS